MKNKKSHATKSKMKGMTLIEVTIAGAMMGLLGLASMKLAENNAKSQKKMNFNSQLAQLRLVTNIQLRKGSACFKNLSGNKDATDTPIELPATGVEDITLETCKSGPRRAQLFNSAGNVFLEENGDYGENTGAKYSVEEIHLVTPKELPGTAMICIKVLLAGMKTLGTRDKWVSQTFDLDGSDGQITSCNAESVADASDACKTLNGTLSDDLVCEGINIAYQGSEIIKGTADYMDNNISDFVNKRIESAAINALGNMGVSSNLHVCGNLTIGNKKFNSFPETGEMGACQESSLFSTNVVGTNIIGSNGTFKNLTISENLNLNGNLNAKDIYTQGNFAVQGMSAFQGTATFDSAIKTKGINNSDNDLNTGSLHVGGITVASGSSNLLINSKVKAHNHDTGIASYLVTEDWVNTYLIKNWSDDDINSLLNTLFLTISNDAQWSGNNTVQTITDFVQKKLTLKNNTDADLSSYMNGSALATKQSSGAFLPSTNFCAPGYSVAHVEVNSDSDDGTLPAELKYYCRSNADSGDQDKLFARVIGSELAKFTNGSINNIFDCESTANITPIGAYCFKKADFCKKSSSNQEGVCNDIIYTDNGWSGSGNSTGYTGGIDLNISLSYINPSTGFGFTTTGTNCLVVKDSSLLQSSSEEKIQVIESESASYGNGSSTSLAAEDYQYPKNGYNVVVMSNTGLRFVQLPSGSLSINTSSAKEPSMPRNGGNYDMFRDFSDFSSCLSIQPGVIDIFDPLSLNYLQSISDLLIPRAMSSVPQATVLTVVKYWNIYSIYQRIK